MKKYIVNVNGNRYEVEVEEVQGDFSEVSMTTTAPVEVTKPKSVEKSSPSIKKSTAEGEKIECPMPGTILSINVNNGDTIKKGDVLFVLEAMKMENEIMAPRDGKIVQIDAVKGGQVNTGDVLAIID